MVRVRNQMKRQDLLSRSRPQLLRVVSSAMGPEDGACLVVVRNGDEEWKKEVRGECS